MKPTNNFGVLLWNEIDNDPEKRQMAICMGSAMAAGIFDDEYPDSYVQVIVREEALKKFHVWLGGVKEGTARHNALIQLINLFENEFVEPFILLVCDEEVWDLHEEHNKEG